MTAAATHADVTPLGPIRIGPHVLRNRVALAPMAGVTDLPFRELCWRLGAGLVVSEMVASNPALRHTRKSVLRRVHAREISPRSVQIAGGDPQMVAAAARFNVEQGAEIVDINMGCPAKKVCNRAAGSALLRDERLVAAILAATVAAVDVPVTLKIRTGWSAAMRNGVTIARIAEDAGVQALAVHGRTREQRFRGEAEFETVARIKQAVSIPVFANGDIDSPARARAVLDETGVDGVMIGRAAQGRPWLCGRIAALLDEGREVPEPGRAERGRILLAHLRRLHEFYGEPAGIRIARKHAGWSLGVEGEPGRRVGGQFNRLETAAEQLRTVAVFYGVDARATTTIEEGVRAA